MFNNWTQIKYFANVLLSQEMIKAAEKNELTISLQIGGKKFQGGLDLLQMMFLPFAIQEEGLIELITLKMNEFLDVCQNEALNQNERASIFDSISEIERLLHSKYREYQELENKEERKHLLSIVRESKEFVGLVLKELNSTRFEVTFHMKNIAMLNQHRFKFMNAKKNFEKQLNKRALINESTYIQLED